MSKFFPRLTKLPVGQLQFVVYERIYKCLFIPNCMRKIMWLCINKYMKKYEIAYHNYAEANPASDVVCSVKTTMYDQNNNILWYFRSLRRKKVQSLAEQFKGLFSLVCYFFALNQPSLALNYLKTAFILANQSWVIFSCILLGLQLCEWLQSHTTT